MTPHRLAIKIYFEDGVTLDLPKFVTLFHGWIRNRSVEGLLIDVADYRHVHEGPAVMLVGHQVDYTIDLSEGRAGLELTRKRASQQGLQPDLRSGLRALLAAARLLQQKAEPHPPVRFVTGEYRVQVIDRLNYPHTPQSLDEVRRSLESALGPVLEGSHFGVEGDAGDVRAPLTLRVTAPGAPDLDTLLSRLESST